MGITEDKIKDLKAREARLLKMGGEKAVGEQKKKGKLTAWERLDLLFDQGTFRELDMFVTHRCSNFGMEKVDIPSDGVITGHGLVSGWPVFAFSQDFTSRAGSLGEMHSRKICKAMDLALKAGVPFVGMNDSGGARIQEAVDALSGYGQIFFRNSACSGVIPDLNNVIVSAASGLALSAVKLVVQVGNVELYADPMFEKVFYTLLENTLRHGETVTTIEISCSVVPGGLVITYRDDGVGVHDEYKEAIFQRKYFRHTGFGLFLSRTILAITGMAIRETGTYGKGARFEILIPVGTYRFY